MAWDLVCVPEKERGLGLKMIEEWNKATIIGHIWNLFTKADSFSVAWGKKNLLKEKSF